MSEARGKAQVWVVLQQPRKRWVLLLQTTAARGGFWQPITGGLEVGETPEAGAARELREETGLRLTVRSLGDAFAFEKQGQAFLEHPFWCELSVDGTTRPAVRIDSREHQAYAWLPLSEVEEVLKFDSNRKIFQRLVRTLTSTRG